MKPGSKQHTTGAEIARLRRARGLTQAELAQLLGVTDRAVSRWETGNGMPDTAVLTALADALFVTVDALLTGENTPEAPDAANVPATTDASASALSPTPASPVFPPPLATMTGLRSPKALARQAVCRTPVLWRIVTGALGALLLGLALFDLFLPMPPSGTFYALLLLICAVFCFAESIFCLLTRRMARAGCRKDFSPVTVCIYEHECIWQRGASMVQLSHGALRRVQRTKNGFFLQWQRICTFVENRDEAAVALLAEKAYLTIQKKPPTGAIVTSALCLSALSVGLALLLGLNLTQYLNRYSIGSAYDLPALPQRSETSDRTPYFSGSERAQFCLTDRKAWFTTDGGTTLLTPRLPDGDSEFWQNATPFTAYASESNLCALYESDNALAIGVSNDGGQQWHWSPLPDFERPVTWYDVNFVSPLVGYVALGTDWSMGGGEQKCVYTTNNGGISWMTLPDLPLQGTSHTLCGFAMNESGTAALSLTTAEEEDFPLVYVLEDGDSEWIAATIAWDTLPLSYVHAVKRIDKDDSGYQLTLTQEPYAGRSATVFAKALTQTWTASA